MLQYSISLLVLLCLPAVSSAQKIVLTNDDGWAVAQVRAEYSALKAAGYSVVLSAPADNRSGTGSSSAPPVPLTKPCEFKTCPTGSPATGSNASDPFLNYVNSFPVDAVRFGIQTLAPKLLGGKPDFVFSGSNIGNNLGPSTVAISGTIGAASEAALEGIPSVAFSGASGSQVSYTTLQSSPNSASTLAAQAYTTLSLKFMKTLLASPAPILPPGISINVNYPSTSKCPTASSFSFVFTRIAANSGATDVRTCGTTHLPDERSVIKQGCFATVSVFNASTKADVPAATQAVVLNKLSSILTCLP
ncbi:putative survival protein SurE [Lyophyllum shimeji]|uniref:Survival protein SurE n=1 Tax=Lyophyllum shimeji TaxID=47721 RepID=A0A9P3UTG7_LYOSH|nr:putative survival protein SurE [Lyophyllum shimeji]